MIDMVDSSAMQMPRHWCLRLDQLEDKFKTERMHPSGDLKNLEELFEMGKVMGLPLGNAHQATISCWIFESMELGLESRKSTWQVGVSMW